MKKTILITGVTGALGKAVAREFAIRGNLNIVLIGRDSAKLNNLKQELSGLHSGNVFDTVSMDLSDPSSINAGVEKIRAAYPHINALINVAAVYKAKKELTKKGFETMFATNHLGPFHLTNRLLDIIRRTEGAKVLTVTAPSSTKFDFDNLNGEKKFSALSFFGASKMQNLLFAFRLARDFEKSSQSSIAFHPGLVKSELLNEAPAILSGIFKLISSKPEKSAQTICDLILKDEKGLNGKFFTKGGKEMKASPYAYDTDIQEKLWKKSLELIA